jgi:hypothetical protein
MMQGKRAMKRMILGLLTAAALVSQPGAAIAQGNSGRESYADEQHRNDCRLAHQVLTDGQPANKHDWALETAPGCGALGGEALAAVLLAHRGDDTAGDELEVVVGASVMLRDAALFRAGLQLAGDAAAGRAARVAGWQVVHAQLTGVYPAPTEGEEDAGQVSSTLISAPVVRGVPLPADHLVVAREVADRVVAIPDTPPVVKELAEDLLAALDLEAQVLRVCGPGGSLGDDACRDAVDADDGANP